MDFTRRKLPITIDGYEIMLVEPIRQEIVKAQNDSKEVSATGQSLINRDTFRANLLCSMVESWKDPKKNLVPREEFEKAIKNGLPHIFYEKLQGAMDVILNGNEEDKAFLDNLTQKAQKTPSLKL